MPTYQPNIPTGSVELDQDYLNLQGNFQQLNIAYGVDHVPLTDTSGVPPTGITGIHKIIHLQSMSTPSAINNVGQLFNTVVNDTFDTDTILYFLTGKGKLLQLTSNLQPSLTTTGYTFLPGGVLLQWGTINAVSQTDITVVFANIGAKEYPTKNLGVWTNIQNNSNSVNVVYTFSFTTAGFHYRNTSSSVQTFNWISIGF